VSATYGRFVLEEGTGGVRFRVRSADSVTLWRAAALGGVGLLVVFPMQALGSPLTMLVSIALCMHLIATGMAVGSRGGVALSRYSRVRRLLEIDTKGEIQEKGAAPRGAPFRSAAGPVVVVDGQSFARADVVGVVNATSNEWQRMAGKAGKKVVRYRPTLLVRGAAFELDVMEGADEASARELCDVIASAIAQRRIKAPSVEWHAPAYARPALLWQLVEGLLVCVAPLAGMYLALAHPGQIWMASASLVLLAACDQASAREMTRRLARERSAAGEKLLADARAALAHHGT
jgi:hypothetical protein